ncbi:autotransporter domain-containing protein [Erwiniaceae bacterium BAC15a-03b]|uniref:Autotransporter domain-containing protein n=1 Tax=Winslowiella arboricola TaxID=2978220 RepID=A0A9J6PKF8_9GAMM|nr:autotransporter domain-containing protein [Winslowiella arboricola]MCU5772328.1 autotransporter domain-containing protein [Winslowiella arboricola]MCU5776192.1 autotransporter domain-containing protein [Winslowiella arboricola]
MLQKREWSGRRLAFGGLLTAWLLTLTLQAHAWDQLYVFGDSLSDSGNNGRYTWDGATHPLYDDILAEKINQTLRPSDDGGTNYAAGNAVAVAALNPADNTQQQVDNYLNATGGRADGNGLYIHWVGGNDLAAAALNPGSATEIVNNSAFAAASQVQTLVAAGASTVIVPTVPNVGATPALLQQVISVGLLPVADTALALAFQSLNSQSTLNSAARQQAIQDAMVAAAGALTTVPALQQAIADQLYASWQQLSSQLAALTDSYNQQEDRYLASFNGNIVRVDVNGLFNEVLADPARYGLSNTAGMACPPGVSAAVCSVSTPGFAREQAYLFADPLHPSPNVHLLIGDYMQSVLDAPVQVMALNQATQAMARDMRNTLDSRLQQQRHSNNPQGSLSVYGGYAGQHNDVNRELGDGNATTHNLTLGVDYKLTDRWLVGALVSASDDKQRPTPDYDYKMRGWLVSAYSELSLFEGGWVNADLHFATADYDDIERRITLGPATRREQGATDGKQLGARVSGGWDFPVASWLTTGPTLQYAVDYSRVAGYSEQDNLSTSMRFNDQTYHSQTGAVGWRLDSQLGWVNPWAEVSYNHQFGDDVWRAGGGLKSTQTSFTRDSAEQDSNWVDVRVGAHMPLGENLAAFASVSQTDGLSSGEQFMYNLGVSARF